MVQLFHNTRKIDALIITRTVVTILDDAAPPAVTVVTVSALRTGSVGDIDGASVGCAVIVGLAVTVGCCVGSNDTDGPNETDGSIEGPSDTFVVVGTIDSDGDIDGTIDADGGATGVIVGGNKAGSIVWGAGVFLGGNVIPSKSSGGIGSPFKMFRRFPSPSAMPHSNVANKLMFVQFTFKSVNRPNSSLFIGIPRSYNC